jgi:hypothetical protein
MFDFVHRNPKNYGLQVSLLPTQKSVLGVQFVPPYKAQTLFEETVKDGYPATSLWWPATFPAKMASPVRTIPGLGTPDIFGRLGVGVAYYLDPPKNGQEFKTRIEKLNDNANGHYSGRLEGPTQKTLTGMKSASLDFELTFDQERSAYLSIGKQNIDLELGKWSPIIELNFKLGFGISIKSITRVLLVKPEPAPILYFLPLQAHPLSALWPYATPKSFVKDLWKNCGPFLTLGWPQDTTALEEGFINNDQFLDLCDHIFEERKRVFNYLLDSFEEGVLACVFDTLDRLQHMFWKDRKDVVKPWYLKLDELVGQVLEKLNQKHRGTDIQLLIVSDHGFGDFNFKVHLNRWLIDHKYLVPKQEDATQDLKGADWSKSQAYALGLNSLYINLKGREGEGIVPLSEKSNLIQNLREELLKWRGPDGGAVIQKILTQEEAFEGPLTEYGPDLVIGYSPGYRASAETGLGQWGVNDIEVNNDHWSADHCFAAETVPGVIFSNKGLKHLSDPSFADIPLLALGKHLSKSDAAPPPSYSDEDQEAVEKRLKDLGYL